MSIEQFAVDGEHVDVHLGFVVDACLIILKFLVVDQRIDVVIYNIVVSVDVLLYLIWLVILDLVVEVICVGLHRFLIGNSLVILVHLSDAMLVLGGGLQLVERQGI